MIRLLPDIASDLKVLIPAAGISGLALGVVIGAPLIVMIARMFSKKDFVAISSNANHFNLVHYCALL
jgi:predicted MFS family arabinose efflux permease